VGMRASVSYILEEAIFVMFDVGGNERREAYGNVKSGSGKE
jgi:hypothetical protein